MKIETKGIPIISLSEFEKKAYEFYTTNEVDTIPERMNNNIESLHNYNLLISRQVTKEDFVGEIPLFIGEWIMKNGYACKLEDRKFDDKKYIALDIDLGNPQKICNYTKLQFNPLHPTIKEFEQILT